MRVRTYPVKPIGPVTGPGGGLFESAVAAALCRRTLPQARDWRANQGHHSIRPWFKTRQFTNSSLPSGQSPIPPVNNMSMSFKILALTNQRVKLPVA